MRSTKWVFALLLLAAGTLNAGNKQIAKFTTRIIGIPVNTRSLEARQAFDKGFKQFETLRTNEALASFRKAAEKDSQFAVAHLFIARVTTDPAERNEARQKAEDLLPSVSHDEALLIQWFAGAQEGKFVSAISAMNELLSTYKNDPHLYYFAAVFFTDQKANDRAVQFGEQALKLDSNYPAVMNQLGYAYSWTRQTDKAIAVMEKYVRVLPNEPNPEDSYAEILRMSGRYEDSLVHYRKALSLDPKFDSSQVGLADTYQLMGRYEEARQNYSKAVQMVPDEATELTYLEKEAQTYVRAGDFSAADKAFSALAERAHKALMTAEEAQLLRSMALYQTDNDKGLKILDEAEKALTSGNISAAERTSQRAWILRDRAIRAAASGRPELAERTLNDVRAIADDDPSALIQQAYHVAFGAVLVSQQKNADAAEHLAEDRSNPLALSLMGRAYDAMKSGSQAQAAREQLGAIHEPTIEQAVVSITDKSAVLSLR